MSNGYRTLSQHLHDLKKENFSLKLRIYFLEERIQQKYEESSEDVHRRNIELKVEVESLKQELQEKQQLLDNALSTVESLTNHNEVELQRRCEERQQEIDHMQEILQTKIQLLQEEAKLARSEAEKMATAAESESQRCLALERKMKEAQEEMQTSPGTSLLDRLTEKDKAIEELTQALHSKEALIEQLTEEKASLQGRVDQLEDQVQDLSDSLQQKEQDAEFFQDELGREKLRIQQQMQSLIEEQQTQLNQYECAAGQCVSELQKAQLQVQKLQARIHKSEVDNKKLQEKLYEMESELQSVRQASQQRERTIQALRDTAGTKDREAQELYNVIEGQKEMLFKLREVTQRHQLQHLQVSDREVALMQRELLALQESLFSTQLELQGSQRAERRSQWRAADVARDHDRLQADLEEALERRGATEQHNQELRGALQKARSNLQAKEDQLKEVESEKQAEVEAKDKTIQQLRISLRNKEQMVQEYLGLLDQQGPNKSLNTVLQKLKERIKERDIALEHAIDDKFRCLEEKDGDMRRLQLALREKERDLERLRYVLSKNEETITTLEGVLRGRELELEQVREANKNLQWLKQEAEEQQVCGLKERDAIIGQLRTSLQSRAKEAEDLTAALLSKAVVDGQDALEELQLRLQLKERLFQEALSDRARQAEEHQGQVQELLAAIGTRDHYIKESVSRLGQVIADRTGELHELRRQLAARELEVAELSQQREQQREQPSLQMERLQSRLREKESFIRVLMNGTQYTQDEPMATSKPEEPADTGNNTRDSDSGLQVDIHAVREELQLVLKKEKEAQLELCALRTTLAKDKEEILTLATELETYTRKLGVKEEFIKDLLRQLVDPSEVPLVQKLTQELQELREEQGDTSSAGHQHVLEQLVSDYNTLSEAVRMEKRAYESLVQASTSASSPEKTRELQRELDVVQSLRGQLEDHLEKTRHAAAASARAVKAQTDFGGGKQRSLGLRQKNTPCTAGGSNAHSA